MRSVVDYFGINYQVQPRPFDDWHFVDCPPARPGDVVDIRVGGLVVRCAWIRDEATQQGWLIEWPSGQIKTLYKPPEV